MATITPKELAQELNSDGRTVRKFLRSVTPKEDHPGKGSRWAIEKRQVKSLKKKFSDWEAARQEANEDEVDTDEVIDEVEVEVEDTDA